MATTYQQTDSNGLTTSHPTTAAPSVGSPGTNWTSPGVVGNDVSGAVSATSGGSAPGPGVVTPVLFGTVYAKPPTVLVTGPLGAYASNVASTGFSITTAITAATSTAYLFNYVVVP